MPVRSLTSSVLRWPDRSQIDDALRAWLPQAVESHPELLRLGVFGSYARGDAGVGSDLDLVAVVESSDQPFERRALDWDLLDLPVPAEVVVYTRDEWKRLMAEGGRFAKTLERETRWLFERKHRRWEKPSTRESEV